MKDFKRCMDIINRWEETPPISKIQKSNTAAEDFRAAAIETLTLTSVLVLVWTLITFILYF